MLKRLAGLFRPRGVESSKPDPMIMELRSLATQACESSARHQHRVESLLGEVLRQQQELITILSRKENRGKAVAPLSDFGATVFSQNGEDGVIGEIARRLGLEIRTFVEIGAGDGAENNSLLLLFQGANGIWAECEAKNIALIRDRHREFLDSGRLTLIDRAIDRENVNELLIVAGASPDSDLFSLDIDGNDYWVWEALEAVKPKIVAVEYNATFGSSASWVKRYDREYRWAGGNTYYGASLKAMEKLGASKGYTLVGCDYYGANAFFVRNDLLNDRFEGPFTSEALYHPRRAAYAPRRKMLRYLPYDAV